MITHVGTSDEPDATDDRGAAFFTGNVLAYDSDPKSSDRASMSAYGTGAHLGRVSCAGDRTSVRNPKSCFYRLFDGETAADTFSQVLISFSLNNRIKGAARITAKRMTEKPKLHAANSSPVSGISPRPPASSSLQLPTISRHITISHPTRW